jgi:hypothetical protein
MKRTIKKTGGLRASLFDQAGRVCPQGAAKTHVARLGAALGTDASCHWRQAGAHTAALCIAAILLLTSGPRVCAGSFVYETPGEFLTSADFNNDGDVDVLVLDKATGNVRLGLADATGALYWSAPLVTGVQNASGCAVGRLLQVSSNALAVTAPDFNLINLVDLSNTNSAPAPGIVTPTGIGPHSLVTLSNTSGGLPPAYTSLLAASSDNSDPAERLDLMGLSAGVASRIGEFAETGLFDRANELVLSTRAASFAVGLVRGTNDRLDIWQFTNAPGVMVSLSNLPAGSDYAFGTFNGEPLPRFLVYRPGGSNVTMYPLMPTTGGYSFGAAVSVLLTEAVQCVFYLSLPGDGSAMIQFSDGIQALRFPGGSASLGSVYRQGTGTAGNMFTGLVPLGPGQLVLLDAPSGSLSSVHAQVLGFDGTTYTLRKTSNLPPTTTRGIRGNAWLFVAEPFVNRQPGFLKSLNAPDWSDSIRGLPGSTMVSQETDLGTNSGLQNVTTNNLGPAPAGAQWGLANQYRDVISLFTYSSPQSNGPVLPMISPPPGPYGGPLQISFMNLHSGDQVFYRVGAPASWQTYTAAFALTNDATIQFYGVNSGSSVRSRLQAATYTIGRNLQPVPTLDLTTGASTTNPPVPPPTTNLVQLSPFGTVFYGRHSGTNGYTIWAIGLDGSGDTFLTSGARPRVSRDGHSLAFLRGGSPLVTQGNLWVRDLTTGQESLLFSNFNYTVGYDWDLTETNVVFDNSCHLWKISLASHGVPTVLPLPVSDCYDAAPVVSPADRRIAFHNLNSNPNISGLYLAAANGTARQRLNFSVPGASWPAWSPDGQWLSFADANNTAGAFSADGGTNLWIVHPDGTGLTRITGLNDGTNGFPHGALWSPGGNALVGAGTIFGTNGLWIIPLTPDFSECMCPPILVATTLGDAIDFAGSIIVAPPVPNIPELFIRLDTNAVTVYWSTNFPSYTLESTTNLPPAGWQPVAGPYPVNGLNYEHSEPLGTLATRKFFRLYSP